MVFSFSQSEHERLEVDVLNYERQPTGDYWDDNWVVVEVAIHAGAFGGKFHATFITSELHEFSTKLRVLYETLKGRAEFSTMEGQLGIDLRGDGKGHIELKGEALDASGIGNQLTFTLRFDQTQLKTSIQQLEKVLSQFPIRSA